MAASEAALSADTMARIRRKIGAESFDVLIPNQHARKQAWRLSFDLGGASTRHTIQLTNVAGKQDLISISSIQEVVWVAADDTALRLNVKAFSKKAKGSTSPTTSYTICFRSFLERELFGSSLEALRPDVATSSDAEQWINPTTVRYFTESVNKLGMRSELNIDLDCSQPEPAILLKEGTVRIPAHAIKFLHKKSTNPRRLDMEWDPEDMEDGSESRHEEAPEQRRASTKMTIADTLAALFTGSNKLVIRFKSTKMKEQFAGRLRAVQCGMNIIQEPTNPEALEPVAKAIGEHLEVFCATWNVGDRSPPSDPALLDLWVPAGAYDIYAIGFQENSKKHKWLKALMLHLNSDESLELALNRLEEKEVEDASITGHHHAEPDAIGYELFGVSSLWDIHVMILMRSDLVERVTARGHSTEATGIAHVLGNKGSAALSFTLDDNTSFAFVTSHLAAQAKHKRLLKRQENYEETCQGLRALEGKFKGVEFLHKFDHVFWFGDMNYRVDFHDHGTVMEYNAVLKIIKDNKHVEFLLPKDQLAQQMDMQRVFVGFKEGAIKFQPTYRWLKGEREYSNKKNQNPSYCDRVLWKSAPGCEGKVKQTLYQGVFDLLDSDHRPVAAAFDVRTCPPYVMRTTSNKNGRGKVCLLQLNDVTYMVAPDTSDPKQTHVAPGVKYDGYNGECQLQIMAPFMDGKVAYHSTAPVQCENRSACTTLKNIKQSTSVDECSRMIRQGAVPMWHWNSDHVGVIKSTVADPEWLGDQRLVVKLCRTEGGVSVWSQGEIPLLSAFESLSAGHTDAIGTVFTSAGDLHSDGSHLHPWNQALNVDSTEPKHEYVKRVHDDKNRGGMFSVPMLISGKFVGILFGRVSILEFDSRATGDLSPEQQIEQIENWQALVNADREADAQHAGEGVLCLRQEALTAEPVPSREAHEPAQELPEENTELVKVMDRPKPLDLPLSDGPRVGAITVYNFNRKLMSKAARVYELHGDESDDELEKDEEVDDDVAQQEIEVYLLGDEVIYRNGQRVHKDDFKCIKTGESLLNIDFVLYHENPYSRKSYLEMFRNDVDAGSLQPLRPGDNVLQAMGYYWKVESFLCTYTRKPIGFDQFFIHKGLPYSEEAYVELFRICPGCSDPVMMDDGSAVEALGHIWHAEHFCCSNPECEEPELAGRKYMSRDRDDGMGPLPYCHDCFVNLFCPICPGSARHIMPNEEAVEACGALWHRDYFRCASTGDLLTDEYYLHDDLPYSKKAYFQNFGKVCACCCEEIHGDVIETMGQHWHPECFICSSSGLQIPMDKETGAIRFEAHELKPYSVFEYTELFGHKCHFCREGVVDDQKVTHPEINGEIVERVYHPECLRCIVTREVLDPAKDEIMFGIDDGLPYAHDAYFEKYGKDFLTGDEFGEDEELYLIQGLPFKAENYFDLMADNFCAGCGKVVIGTCKVTPKLNNFRWHPGCLDTYLDRSVPKDSKLNPYEVDKMTKERIAQTKNTYHKKMIEYQETHERSIELMKSLCKSKQDEKRRLAERKNAANQKSLKFATSSAQTWKGKGAAAAVAAVASAQSTKTSAAEARERRKNRRRTVLKDPMMSGYRGDDLANYMAEGGGGGGGGAEEFKGMVIEPDYPKASFDGNSFPPPPPTDSAGSRYSSSSPALSPAQVQVTSRLLSRRGYMSKLGGATSAFTRKKWQKRFFVLQDAKLQYWKAQEDYTKKPTSLKDATYDMRLCDFESYDDAHFGIIIYPQSPDGGPRPMELRCATSAERELWIQTMRACAGLDLEAGSPQAVAVDVSDFPPPPPMP